MNAQELLYALFSTATQHIRLPEGMEHAPLFATAAVGIFGVLLMLRGAKWAAGLGSLAFLGVGALAGTHLANQFGTPVWPTVGISAAACFVIGLVLFRIWQAVMLAACCAGVALSAYYVKDLAPHVNSWLGDGSQVTLPAEGT